MVWQTIQYRICFYFLGVLCVGPIGYIYNIMYLNMVDLHTYSVRRSDVTW